jgi:hypothetical protein
VVIIIIAIISAILIVTIKPAETVKKARDVQRMSDLNMIKSVIGYVLISSSTPYLAQNLNDCLQTSGSQASVFYSYDKSTMTCAGAITAGADAAGTFTAGDFCKNVTTGAGKVDGTGWIPINFKLSSDDGVSISQLPIDPSNSIGNPNSPNQTDLTYRYSCQSRSTTVGKPSNVFEIDATLESDAYTITVNKSAEDGGDNDSYFEVGTDLELLPKTNDF